MNRVIKFRGKSVVNEEWVYGDLLQDGHNVYIFPDGYGFHEFKERLQKVITGTEGQFTGLKDKQGQYIYDGDILDNGRNLWLVDWNNNHACFQVTSDPVTVGVIDNINMVVVGNIYQKTEVTP